LITIASVSVGEPGREIEAVSFWARAEEGRRRAARRAKAASMEAGIRMRAGADIRARARVKLVVALSQ
jgi:hypothetical protein